MLKRRYTNTQEEWMYVYNNYDKIHSKEHIDKLIDTTVAEIHKICDGKNVAYSWSGGKDSLVLQLCCERAGIKKGYCCYNDLYFKQSIKRFHENTPEGVELVNTGENIEWLKDHPDMLWPKDPQVWNVRCHLRYQKEYCKKNKIDILLMGKRSKDGNNVPKEIVCTYKNGVSIYCPLRNWSHEEIICAIRYYNLVLSPIYFTTEYGFHYGDSNFCRMNPFKGETFIDAWRRIYAIEPEKVIACAKAGLPMAFEFLEGIYGKNSV